MIFKVLAKYVFLTVCALGKSLCWQKAALCDYLDPIGNRFPVNHSKWDLKFLMPLLSILCFCIYGFPVLEYQYEGTIDWGHMVYQSRLNVFHQMYQEGIWPQSDITMALAYGGGVCILMTFLRNPHNIRYEMSNGSRLIISGISE